MSKWVNSTVLDGQLNIIKNTCDELRLLSSYSVNDTYATIVAHTISRVTMISTDFVISGSTGSDRVLNSSSGKIDNSATGAKTGGGMHFAFCNSAGSSVLWVSAETSGRTVNIGDQIVYPPLSYTSKQPA